MNAWRTVCVLLLTWVASALVFAESDGELRTWTSKDGKYTVDAEFVRAAGNLVWLKRADGRTISVPLYRLSTEDQSLVSALAAQPSGSGSTSVDTARPPRLDIFVKKSKRTRKDGTDYDNESQSVSLSIRVRNREVTRGFTGLKARVYVIAQSASNKREYRVIMKEDYELELPVNGEHEYETGTRDLQFDDNYMAKFGYKWEGYVWELLDTDGNPILTKASPTKLEKCLGKIRKAKIDKDFRLR